jgi:mono/diheme cytochrome c family protein
MTSSLLIRGARALALVAAVTVCGAAPHAADTSFTPLAGFDTLDGPGIYGHICQGCHMPGGSGAVGAGHYPKLAGDAALTSWRYVAITVLNGKNGMPAFGEGGEDRFEMHGVHLSDAQVAAVVNYVRTRFGNRFKGVVTAQQVATLPHPTQSAAP